jgi:hypothetical protein
MHTTTPLDTPASPAAQPPEAARSTEQLISDAKAAHFAARVSLEAEEGARASWCEHTLKLSSSLFVLRQLCQNNNKTFHRLLNDNGLGEDFINKDDRPALLNMAEHPDVAKEVLAATQSRSWQLIWREGIRPKVEEKGILNAKKTPSGPNRGGRPRKAPTPSDGPPESVVERELIAKCSSPEWLPLDKLASAINRAPSFTRDVLKTMDAKGLVEQRKAADGVAIEYRIHDKRDATPDVVALKCQVDDLEKTILGKDERIADLERLLEEAFAENDDLKQRIARLEAVSDVGPSALQPETVH